MVTICPLISYSSSPFTKPLGIVQGAPITIGITATFMFHSFYSYLERSRYLYLFLLSSLFTQWSTIRHFFYWPSQNQVVWPRLGDLFVSQSHREVHVSQFPECIYHLFLWSNLNLLQNTQSITLLTQSCLVFFSFHANLLHSLIMWLIISSLLPLNQDLIFCCVLSIFTLT